MYTNEAFMEKGGVLLLERFHCALHVYMQSTFFILHTTRGYGTRPYEYISHNRIPKLQTSDLFENFCKKIQNIFQTFPSFQLKF